MAIINLLKTILILLVLTCLFCLVMTTDLGLDPVDNLVFYVGGVVLIGWVTVASLNIFHD